MKTKIVRKHRLIPEHKKSSCRCNKKKTPPKPAPKSAPKKVPTSQPKGNRKQGPSQKKSKPQQASGTIVAKVPKSAAQKNFVLQPDTSTPNPLIMKTVCFDVQDQKYGTQLAHHLFPDDLLKLKPSLKKIKGALYLFGTITGCLFFQRFQPGVSRLLVGLTMGF